MTEMIDRVSKAIDAAIDRYFAEWREKAEADPTIIPWIGMADIPREVFARAAIEAMREPTPDMTSCNEDVASAWGYSCHVCGGPKKTWEDMIDAAIGEKSDGNDD